MDLEQTTGVHSTVFDQKQATAKHLCAHVGVVVDDVSDDCGEFLL